MLMYQYRNRDNVCRLLKGMQYPKLREYDYKWLLKNLSTLNSQHRKYAEIMKVLRRLVDELQ